MLKRCYYRCPVIIEDGDEEFPRFFVLAQVIEYNELADAIKVKMHDLLGSGQYYRNIFLHDVFRANAVTRCEAVSGGAVECALGRGTIISRTEEPFNDSEPYWYWIKLSNGKIIKECETNLKIEYSQMNFSPVKQFRNYEFQNPAWFLNHLKVSRNEHLVNNATYGFNVLAGCRAFLLPHQISTIARCFETMPVRYMLADEVGLGKTVEACSVLKILASENNDLRSLLIVPGALATQWKNELHYKFNLEANINTPLSQICIIPLEDLSFFQTALLSSWDLVIVDETHRLLANDDWYHHVQSLSRRVKHFLLLSATPIQDRNEEYRRLLALLSPEQYAEMTPDRFSWLVKKQQRIQRTVNQQLGRLDRYDEYKEIIADKLNEISESLDDAPLQRLIDSIDIHAEDNGIDTVKQALAYICENYRVERRVIRNRRQLITQKMAKRSLWEIPYTPLSANENYNESAVIQNTLSFLSENGEDSEDYVLSTAIPLLSSLFSSPWAFEDTLKVLQIQDSILTDSATTWRQQAENEHALVFEALKEDPDLIKGRLLNGLNYIDQYTDILDDIDFKMVVFTGFNATLSEFLILFNNYYKEEGIYAVPFGAKMSREELEDSVYSFQNDPHCKVIICDETGGEGRNFQNASEILHLDIPWNANALEQRIGRLDRLGRNPEKEVKSVILYSSETVEEQLINIWKNGLCLFEQSLSGLEIITGELNNLIVDSLLTDYYTGLVNAFDDILEQAEEMRESVEDEQDFDIGTTLYRPMSHGIENVLSLYTSEHGNLFATAMMSWGQLVGLTAQPSTKTELIEFQRETFSVNAAKQSLFIPPDWNIYNDSAIIRREGKLIGSFNRKTAALREDILFFAPGDPVYDAIISNALGCSRGRCTAIEAHGSFNYDGAIYIYNVVPYMDELLENGIELQTLAQYRMYLPLEQIMVCVPLTLKSRDVPTEKVLQKLLSLNSKEAWHLGRRSAYKGMMSPLETFILRTPPSTWEPLIDKISTNAYKKASLIIDKESNVSAAQKEMQRVLNGYRAECLYFERDTEIVEQKEKIFQATLRALKNAKPELDAICFLRVRSNG